MELRYSRKYSNVRHIVRSNIYEIFCDLGKALYKKKQIKLPKPEFYMLYNGTEPCPANTELRLAEGFLSELLTKYSKELVNLFNLYYDENMAIEVAKEEAWEDGLEKGVKKGVKKGESNLIKRMLKKGKSPESIAFDTDIPIEQIAKINERLKSVV